MQIETGKYYKTRDGRKVGPMRVSLTREFAWVVGRGEGADAEWYPGTGGVKLRGPEGYGDIVSEWGVDGPVRTETLERKVIVEGTYGIVSVSTWKDGSGKIGPVVSVPISEKYTAIELREAAATFIALAGVLESNK